jgi:hypothetical protein
MSFLPGMFPAGAAAAAAGLTTLSLFASATSLTHEVTVPAGVQAGDLIIIMKNGFGLGTPSAATPSGFTNIFNVTSSTSRFTAWYKIAVGTEASTVLTLDNGNVSDRICLGVFRGNKAIVAVSPQDIEAVVPTTDPAAQVITASGGIAPVIVCGADVDSFSPAAEGSITADTFVLSYEIYNVGDTLADVTIDRADAGDSNSLGGFYVNCS